MADIELVIRVDEKIYQEALKSGYSHLYDEEVANAVANGIPLPKGHGRLIDADELYGDFIDGTEGYDCQTWNRIEIGGIIEDAPTIIEADKDEEEE